MVFGEGDEGSQEGRQPSPTTTTSTTTTQTPTRSICTSAGHRHHYHQRPSVFRFEIDSGAATSTTADDSGHVNRLIAEPIQSAYWRRTLAEREMVTSTTPPTAAHQPTNLAPIQHKC